MKISVTAWSFPALQLGEIVGVTRALGIEAVDIGLFYASALDRAQMLGAPVAYGTALSDYAMPWSNYYHLFGTSLQDRNLADRASLDANLSDFRAVVQFCQAAEIPSVMVLPGVVNPRQTIEQALDVSANALRRLLSIAQEYGVQLAIEPHVHSCLESPARVLQILDLVPGLKLVLDYAHFVCLGYRQEEIDPLSIHAAHIHLRQARPGALQAKLDLGTINFPALLGRLTQQSYTGYLAIEYVHQDYMDTRYDDVLTETVRMRDLVREYTSP